MLDEVIVGGGGELVVGGGRLAVDGWQMRNDPDLLIVVIQLADYVAYVGPHVISGEGWQFAFDFGHTEASLFWTPDSKGVELMAFGAKELQLVNLELPGALEVLKGLVA